VTRTLAAFVGAPLARLVAWSEADKIVAAPSAAA
jgi:hypothetical protein